jgi:nucleotide-binding universal stress UspA family protein
MSFPRRILAATDFSPTAERAVARAVRLASQHGAELHLLHVVRPLDLYPALTLEPDALAGHDAAVQQVEQSRLELAAAELAARFGIQVRAAARIGRVHAEIAEYAQTNAADLVVVGARGENTLLDLLMGATASRLLRLVSLPVLIVRRPGDAPYRKVLAAVDLSPVSIEVVRHVRALAGDAAVAVLHVLGSEVEQRLRRAKLAQADITNWLERQRAEAGRQLDGLLSGLEAGPTIGRSIRHGLASAEICRCIEETGTELVALGRHGHGGPMHEWMLGSVSKDVAFATGSDVLMIHLPAAA